MKKYIVFNPRNHCYSPTQNLLTHLTRGAGWDTSVCNETRFTYNEAIAIVKHLKAFFATTGYYDNLVIIEVEE